MMTDGSAFYQLQEEIRHAFEGMVIDLPRNMMVQHPHLLNDVHVVIVVCEFTLAGTRDAIRILSWLKANAPQARVVVVANRVQVAVQEVSRKDFEHSIERKVDVLLPFDPKAAVAGREARPAAGQGHQVDQVDPAADPVARPDRRSRGQRCGRRLGGAGIELAAGQARQSEVARRQEAQGGRSQAA
jgi:pilus assembly protein CpaE